MPSSYRWLLTLDRRVRRSRLTEPGASAVWRKARRAGAEPERAASGVGLLAERRDCKERSEGSSEHLWSAGTDRPTRWRATVSRERRDGDVGAAAPDEFAHAEGPLCYSQLAISTATTGTFRSSSRSSSMSDVGHRIRAACTICDRSRLAQVAKERVSPDPAVRAEAADADAEEWKDAPSRLQFDATCPECESTTPHKLPKRSSFPGGSDSMSVSTSFDRYRSRRSSEPSSTARGDTFGSLRSPPAFHRRASALRFAARLRYTPGSLPGGPPSLTSVHSGPCRRSDRLRWGYRPLGQGATARLDRSHRWSGGSLSSRIFTRRRPTRDA